MHKDLQSLATADPYPPLEELRARTILGLLIVALLSNVVSIVAGSGRGAINVDFLVVPALCVAIGFRWAAVCYIGLCVIDLLAFLGPVYHFNAVQLLSLSRYLPRLTLDVSAVPVNLIALWLLSAAAGVGTVRWAWRFPCWRHAVVSVLLIPLLLAFDSVGSSSIWGALSAGDEAQATRFNARFASSGSYSLVRDAVAYWKAHKPGPWLHAESATRVALAVPNGDFEGARVVGRNFALIVVESWGHRVDQSAADAQVRAVTGPEIAARYEIRRGVVSFSGATTAAELRELCGVRYQHEWLLTADPQYDCLPTVLSRRRFQVTALHGFHASFFDRDLWWPTVGLENGTFLENLGPDQRICGHFFKGACDEDLIVRFGNELAEPGRQFGYLLTLTSHLPLPPAPSDENPSRARSHGDSSVLDALLDRVFDAIATQALRPELADTHFLIVGDHSPPFLDFRSAVLYRHDVVPYVELRPRSWHE